MTQSTLSHKRHILKAWAHEPHYNQVYVYHEEPLDIEAEGLKTLELVAYQKAREALFKSARKLNEAGLVLLFQRRHPVDGFWQYCAKRTRIADHLVLDKVSRGQHVAPSKACLTEYGTDEQEVAI